MVDFIGAARDPQFRQDVGQGLVDAFGRGLAMVGGAPVDLTTMFLRPLGYSAPDEQIIGSSEYIGRQMANLGLISETRNPAAEFLSALLIPDPTDIQKLAPYVQRAMSADLVAARPSTPGAAMRAQRGSVGVEPVSEGSPQAPYQGEKTVADYQISHKPMTISGGAAPLYSLENVFGSDIYGKNALQYFGSGGFDKQEKYILDVMKKVRGKPNEMVEIYRGVPEGVNKINPGDWVTLSPDIAAEYGNVLKMKVPAKDITSWPDSLLEFGYYPTGQTNASPPRPQAPREEALRIAQENAAKPVSEGGLGLPPDNTAMDRARAMGFDVNVYHGTRNAEPITELIPGGRQGAYRSGDAYGVGVYSTTDPRFASSPVYTGETGAVMPLLLNRQEHLNLSSLTPENLNLLERFAAENLLPSDKSRFSSAISQRTFDPDDIEAAKEFFSAQQKNAEQLGGGYDRTQPWVDKDDQGNFVINYTDFDAPVSIKNKEDVETLLKAVGYDATRLMGFAGHTLNKSGSEQWDVTFSPNKLRSRFAAFDPARRYESDLLGSVDPRLLAILGPATAAAVYGLGELYANQRRDEQTR